VNAITAKMSTSRKGKSNPESSLTNGIIRLLNVSLPNAVFDRANAGAIVVGQKFYKGMQAGTADIIGCYKGRFIAIEVKLPKGRVQESQKQYCERITKAGGLYYIVRSFDEAMKVIEEIKRLQK